jgi:hypothetical protein
VQQELDTAKKVLDELCQTAELFERGLLFQAGSVPQVSEASLPKRPKLPSGPPKYHTDAWESRESPSQFIRHLELIFQVANYPSSRWTQALAIQVSGTGAAWVIRTLSHNTDWTLAKESFLQHFDHLDQNTWEPEQKFSGTQSILAYWRMQANQGRASLGEGDVVHTQYNAH